MCGETVFKLVYVYSFHTFYTLVSSIWKHIKLQLHEMAFTTSFTCIMFQSNRVINEQSRCSWILMDEVKWWDLALSIGTQLDHEKVIFEKRAWKIRVVTLSKKEKLFKGRASWRESWIFRGENPDMHKTDLNVKKILSASLRTSLCNCN